MLGPDSVVAAKAALAAAKLDESKYYDFHLALMQSKDIVAGRDAARSAARAATTRTSSPPRWSGLGQGAARRQPRAGREAGHQRHAELRRRQDADPRRRRPGAPRPADRRTSARPPTERVSAAAPASARRRPAAAPGSPASSPWIFALRARSDSRLMVVVVGIGDLATPEHVVECDHAARTDQRQRALVVGVVELLVGVDIDEVEAAGSALGEQPVAGCPGPGPAAARSGRRRPLPPVGAADLGPVGR